MLTKPRPIMLLVTGALMSLLPTAQAYWILGCGRPVVTERLDPIMQPGQVPSSHVHAVMGGNAFSADMPTTENRTQESNCTTCVVTEDLSNYWVPNLYFQDPKNHSFISVKNAGGMNIYYEQRIDPQDPQYSSGIQAFPRGFRMVAGDPYQRNISDPPTLEQRAISFACLSSTSGPQTNDLPDKKCNNGLRVQVSFPSCWDGKNLDSPDHKSHMAYPSLMDNGICPDSHPIRLMYLFYEVMYSVDQFDHLWTEGQGEQPFVFSNGDPTGYGHHGDFLNGWDIALLQKAIDTCGDETGGDIQKCEAFKPYLQDAKEQNKCSKKAAVHEEVSGTLSKLPGCNPIQNGPEKAMPQKC